MTATATELPQDLIRELFESDRTTGGRPVLPAGQRDRARAWLRRALVEFDSLEQHLGLLQSLYDAPFRCPRPRRDCWTAEQRQPPSESTKFRHRERLADDRVAAVADTGVEVLSDEELATLLLNPVALYDLFDVIDELHPEAWTGIMHDVGRELVRTRGQPAAETPRPYPSSPPTIRHPATGNGEPAVRGWLRRPMPALAAGVMLGLTLGLIATAAVSVRFAGRVNELQGEIAELNKRIEGSETVVARAPGLDVHRYKNALTPAREALWKANYRAADSPSENLRRIYFASDKEVKEAIDAWRKEGRPDFEILALAKLAYAPREN